MQQSIIIFSYSKCMKKRKEECHFERSSNCSWGENHSDCLGLRKERKSQWRGERVADGRSWRQIKWRGISVGFFPSWRILETNFKLNEHGGGGDFQISDLGKTYLQKILNLLLRGPWSPAATVKHSSTGLAHWCARTRDSRAQTFGHFRNQGGTCAVAANNNWQHS